MSTTDGRHEIAAVLSDLGKDGTFINNFMKNMTASHKVCPYCGRSMIEAPTFTKGTQRLFKYVGNPVFGVDADPKDKTYLCRSCRHIERDYKQ